MKLPILAAFSALAAFATVETAKAAVFVFEAEVIKIDGPNPADDQNGVWGPPGDITDGSVSLFFVFDLTAQGPGTLQLQFWNGMDVMGGETKIAESGPYTITGGTFDDEDWAFDEGDLAGFTADALPSPFPNPIPFDKLEFEIEGDLPDWDNALTEFELENTTILIDDVAALKFDANGADEDAPGYVCGPNAGGELDKCNGKLTVKLGALGVSEIPETAPIPVPAPIALLGAALFGLFGMRRLRA